MERFDEILWDLGELVALPLHADENRACRLVIDEMMAIQLEMDPNQEKLIVATFLAEIPPGRYREILLKDALKSNSLPEPRFGNFAYVAKNNSLAMYATFMAKGLKGEVLAEYLEKFIEKAKAWKSSIERGAPPPPEYLPKEVGSKKPSIFDTTP